MPLSGSGPERFQRLTNDRFRGRGSLKDWENKSNSSNDEVRYTGKTMVVGSWRKRKH